MRSGEPRVSKNTIIDLSEIRAWLTRCIRERNFEALLVSVIRIVTVLWERNLALQTKVLGARNKPPSERLSTLQGQGVLPGFDRPLSKPSPERGEPDPPTKPERGNPDECRPNHPGRNGFPKHLPRVQRVNPMPEALRHCPKCGVEMSLAGQRKCSYLGVQPARLIVVGRNAWLFVGGDKFGHSAAALLSLIATCLLRSINPTAYLTWLFDRIERWKITELIQLAPWEYQKLQQKLLVA